MSTTTILPMLINVYILLASTISTSASSPLTQLTNEPQGISTQGRGLGLKLSIFQAQSKFLLNLSLGNPAMSFSAILELGSDLIWTQCMPCESCYRTPIFNPNTSSSFSPLPCSNHFCDPKILSIPDIVFGCGTNNRGVGLDIATGFVGLGRGPLSLVSQLKLMKFSYCLPMEGGNKKGTLLLGSAAEEGVNANISQATSLIANPMLPSLYYISPEGISLNDDRLLIAPSVFEQVLRQEFVKRTRLPIVVPSHTQLDLCFQAPLGRSASTLNFPKLKFHFKGGMELELPLENYLTEDTRTGVMCLAIIPSNGVSMLGTKMQQNFMVLHDLETQTISFFPSQCA